LNPFRMAVFFNTLLFLTLLAFGSSAKGLTNLIPARVVTPPPTILPLTVPNPQGPPPGLLAEMQEKFSRDVAGNSIAIITLLLMIGSAIWIVFSFILGLPPQKPWPSWVIVALTLIGLGIGFYLTFIETTQTPAVCGPVGDCNSVQKSQYAYLFGLIPVGILGLLGYLTILIGWIGQRYTNQKWRNYIWLCLWGLSWFGVLFSIYLTFLEPFVIGATCMWCISSAIVMTLLLWATTPLAKIATQQDDDEADEID
jgi:uncharacterized membrane protein